MDALHLIGSSSEKACASKSREALQKNWQFFFCESYLWWPSSI